MEVEGALLLAEEKGWISEGDEKEEAKKKRKDQDGDWRWLGGKYNSVKKMIWEDLLNSVFKFDCSNKFSRILTCLKKQSTYYFKEPSSSMTIFLFI